VKIKLSQLRRIIKEEVGNALPVAGKDSQRFLHGFESGHPKDDEGYMIKSRMADVKEMAETICELLEMGDQLPAWVQDLVASAHTDLEHVKDYLVGDEKMRNYKQGGAGLAEAYTRITPDEIKAWMKGDWGFVAGLNEEKFYDSSTAWAEAAIADGRTVGNLLDAYDDMTNVASGVSGTDYQDLLPLYDVKLSDLTGQDRARAEELRQEIIMLDSLPPM